MKIDKIWSWFCDYFLPSRTNSLATITVREQDSKIAQTYLEMGNSYDCKAKYRR